MITLQTRQVMLCLCYLSSLFYWNYTAAQQKPANLLDEAQIKTAIIDDVVIAQDIPIKNTGNISLGFDQFSLEQEVDVPGITSPVAFTLDNIGFITKGELNADVDRLRLLVEGYTREMQKIKPIVSSYNSLRNSNGIIHISANDTEDICFYFNKEIDVIKIKLEKIGDDLDFHASMSLSSLLPVHGASNQYFSSSHTPCENRSILFALDNSSSVSIRDRQLIKTGILNWLQGLNKAIKSQLRIGMLAFDSDAVTLMPLKPANAFEDIAAALIDYVSMANAEKQGRWTSWSSALVEAGRSHSDKPFDHLLFVTDDIPNGNQKTKTLLSETMHDLTKSASSLRQKNVLITAMGIGDWNMHTAELWFNFLVSHHERTGRSLYDISASPADFVRSLHIHLGDICPEIAYANKSSVATLFPNPTTDQIQLTYNIPGQVHANKLRFRIFDVSGVEVASSNLDGAKESASLDVSDLHEGLYLIQIIMDNDVVFSQSLIIAK